MAPAVTRSLASLRCGPERAACSAGLELGFLLLTCVFTIKDVYMSLQRPLCQHYIVFFNEISNDFIEICPTLYLVISICSFVG